MTIENALRAIAGFFVLLSVALSHYVSPWWLLFTVFVGLNLLQSGFTGWCPDGLDTGAGRASAPRHSGMTNPAPVKPASITPVALHERQQAGKPVELIDVRTRLEYNVVHARGAQSVPLGALAAFIAVRRRGGVQERLYVICHSGGRSRAACLRMIEAGLQNVVNVDGGTAEWRRAGLPVEGAGWLGSGRWLRVGGLLSAMICLTLGLTVAPAFAYAATGIWLLLVLTGNAPCCSSDRCSTNRRG